jgi:septal ring factor EnvC (AmiA/AmiB activator)
VSGFRGSDETLDREIDTLEGIARVRLKRHAREMRELDRDLRELKRERARRRAGASVPSGPVVEEIPGEGAT